jgi:glycosyltransferase involved in cell wall biosynthesis
MKICRVITRLNVGGPALQVAYLHCEFRRQGHDVTLITGALDEGEADGSQALTDDPDVHIFPKLTRPIAPLKDAWVVIQLFWRFCTVPYDVLHTHTAKAGLLARGAAMLSLGFRKWRGFPRLKVMHTYHGHVFKGYFSKSMSAWMVRIERFLAERTDRLIVISSGQHQEIANYLGLPMERLHCVPLGLELSPYLKVERRRLFDQHEPRFVVGWVGRMVPIKGLPLLLKLIQMCRETWRGPERPLFVVVGGGPLLSDFRQDCRSAQLEEDVLCAGWESEMSSVMPGFDVVLNTSLNEGTSVALLEAQASGVPVVATKVGGTPDICGSSSFCFEAEHHHSAVEALQKIAVEGRRLPLTERQDVVDRHDPALLAKRLLQLMR